MLCAGLGCLAQSATDVPDSSLFTLHSSLPTLHSSLPTLHSSLPTLHSSLSTHQSSIIHRDYGFIKRSDPWLSSINAAALTRFATASIAEAELSLTRTKGGFVDYHDSPNALQLEASVESFYRLSDRAVLFGSISYDNFAGKDMAGSAFTQLSPLTTHAPFDIVEDSLGNEGDKHRDVYQLTGGFGVDIYHGLSIGTRLDYTAANYAKYKDLRHKNKLMDLQLSAGFYAPLGRWGAVGANYLYHRNTESLQFSTYGKTDKVYQSLVGYAAFMGQREQFGVEGFTDKSREMPLVNDYNGLSLQFSLHPAILHSSLSTLHSSSSTLHSSLSTLHSSFFNSFSYLHRRGYYGRKSPYTITYTDHHSDIYNYAARLTLLPRRSRLCLDFSLSAENLRNDANTYRELKNDAGATYYNYYAKVKTANKLWVDGNVALTADLGIQGEQPTWTLQAGLDWMHRKQTAYLYPYYRRQRLSAREYFASATHHLATRYGVWSFSLNGSFRQGSGQPCEDLTYTQPSEKMDAPATMEVWLMREYQWLTSAQYAVGGSVKYSFLFPETQMATYAKVSLQHRKSNETNSHSQGCDHTQLSVALGCNF